MIRKLIIELTTTGDIDCGVITVKLDRFEGDRFQWSYEIFYCRTEGYGSLGSCYCGGRAMAYGDDLYTPTERGHDPAFAMHTLIEALSSGTRPKTITDRYDYKNWSENQQVKDALEMAAHELTPSEENVA